MMENTGARGLRALISIAMLLMLSIGAQAARTSPQWRYKAKKTCEAYLGVKLSGMFTAIFTADPGDFSGTPEAQFIIANLKNEKIKPRNTTVCGGIYIGELMGQAAIVVTTGIGPTAASVCTLEIVTACGPMMKEIIYSGTSGWSPQVGGVLNPPDCGAANSNGKINRLGNICVSPLSINWNCRKASWTQQAKGYPNQCFLPEVTNGPDAAFLYGQCEFYEDNKAANLKLADQFLSVIRSNAVQSKIPVRSAKVQANDKLYWDTMSNATGIKYTLPPASTPPTIYDYTQCMEIDGQFFYSGAPWEIEARHFVADVLNKAFVGKNYTAKDVVAVAAMEAVGVSDALTKYHALATTLYKVPYINVRATSNLLHQPVKKTGPGVWEDATQVEEDFGTGYQYAIVSGSSFIMSFYQKRCYDLVAAKTLPPSFNCTFTIPYP